jgi:hypothetical protein
MREYLDEHSNKHPNDEMSIWMSIRMSIRTSIQRMEHSKDGVFKMREYSDEQPNEFASLQISQLEMLIQRCLTYVTYQNPKE